MNASQATAFDRAKAKETAACTVGFISQKLPSVVAFFTGILAALALSACEQKTETTEPAASPAATSPPTTTETTSPASTTESPAEPSATPSLESLPKQSQSDWPADERGVEDQEATPQFPWPPPRASAFDTIPRELLVGNVAHPTLSTVAQAIESAFQQAGYGERSYYGVPSGFAMASQIEQINVDGSPKEPVDRWSLEIPPLRKFSLSSYLNALFSARAGYYRVIVFIVTSKAFPQSPESVTAETSRQWVSSGLNKLPEEIGNQGYSAAHSCTALIYEFKQTGKHADLLDPSQIPAKTHLDKAGLMAAFAKQR